MTAYVFLGGFAGIAVRRGDRLNAFVRRGSPWRWSVPGGHHLHAPGGARPDRHPPAVGRLARRRDRLAIARSGRSASATPDLTVPASGANMAAPRGSSSDAGDLPPFPMVGNLAERAAEAIGADPLMARVAAYYHDVGKLANAGAFIENQAGAGNVHDDLDRRRRPDPEGHVADGIDLPTGRGSPSRSSRSSPSTTARRSSATSMQGPGLAAAPYGRLSTAEGEAANAVSRRASATRGRSPSRRAALIMLADGVEASVTPLRARRTAIRAMVSRIIDSSSRTASSTVRPDPARRRADPRRSSPAPQDVPPADRHRRNRS